MNSDLETLVKLKNQMESEETNLAVQNAKVNNPSQEVEFALTNFVVSRLERIEKDAQFSDLIRMHLRGRLPEFSIDQLLQLNDQVTKNNNKSVEGVLPLFIGDGNSKTVIDHLKGDSVSSTAQTLFNGADKDMLQAVSYLSSVMSKMANTPLAVETPFTEGDK